MANEPKDPRHCLQHPSTPFFSTPLWRKWVNRLGTLKYQTPLELASLPLKVKTFRFSPLDWMHQITALLLTQDWTQSFYLIDASGLGSIKAFFFIHSCHHIYVPKVDEREYAIKVMSSFMFFFFLFKKKKKRKGKKRKIGSVNVKLI